MNSKQQNVRIKHAKKKAKKNNKKFGWQQKTNHRGIAGVTQ